MKYKGDKFVSIIKIRIVLHTLEIDLTAVLYFEVAIDATK